MNRPGLALAGFFSYFAPKRVQVLGSSEMSYLRKLPEGMRSDRFRRMCDREIPCVVVARDFVLEDDLLQVALEHRIPVFGTSMVTMNFLKAATIKLEHDFAPSVTIHGCMVDIRGIGVLLVGSSSWCMGSTRRQPISTIQRTLPGHHRLPHSRPLAPKYGGFCRICQRKACQGGGAAPILRRSQLRSPKI